MTDFDPLTYPTATATPVVLPTVATGGYVPSAIDNARRQRTAEIVAALRAEYSRRLRPDADRSVPDLLDVANMIERGEL